MTHKRPSRTGRVGRLAWILGLWPVTALGLGALYQAVGSASDAARYPPPGQRFDVNGLHLHVWCSGPQPVAGPRVVLESGLGAPGLLWIRVQTALADAGIRVCSYDRPGYGWSDPAGEPWTPEQQADSLRTLLAAAGEAPPYVLVGHSLGGILIREFAQRHPAETAGLVLVDARHEDFFERMPPEYLSGDQENLNRARWLQVMTPLGMTRLAGTLGQLDAFEDYLAPLPDEAEGAAWAHLVYSSNHWRASVQERETIDAAYAAVRGHMLPDDLPLVVLTAEHGMDAWRTDVGPADDAARQSWMTMQEDLASLSTRSQWTIVAGAGHYLQLERPDVVVEAVQAVLRELAP